MKNSVFLRVVSFVFAAALRIGAAETVGVNYEEPKLLTGRIYEMNSGTNKLLFTFKRTATRSNETVLALRDFFYPNGSLAAREEIAFQNGQLLWSRLDERQTGAHGRSVVYRDARNPAKAKLSFDWVADPGAKTKTDTEDYQPNTLVGDMIPYFIVAHWNDLARGATVNFRFIAQSRLETVGFKLVKEAEITWGGQPALRLRMEASSIIIRQIVDPIFFVVEKNAGHRVLEYVGRTTPRQRDGNKWKDLDARTIYDW
jgi:hypothetical protein